MLAHARQQPATVAATALLSHTLTWKCTWYFLMPCQYKEEQHSKSARSMSASRLHVNSKEASELATGHIPQHRPSASVNAQHKADLNTDMITPQGVCLGSRKLLLTMIERFL